MINVEDLKIGDKVRRVERYPHNEKDIQVGDIFTYVGQDAVDTFPLVSDRNGEGLGTGNPGAWEKAHVATVHDFAIGDKVYDITDGQEFIVEGIGDGDFVAAEKGIYGTDKKTGRFVWNWIKDTAHVEEEENDMSKELAPLLARLEDAVKDAEAILQDILRVASKTAEPSPRQLVVEKAKADVADFERGLAALDIVYHVNKEKGVVVARLIGKYSKEEKRKGIARLFPGEKFDENIGKAIALHRAFSSPVPAEFLNAPRR